MQEINIATRHYIGICLRTGTEYPLVDRIVRRGQASLPDRRTGAVEAVRPISLGYAFEWLSELPEEIERTVIVGGFGGLVGCEECFRARFRRSEAPREREQESATGRAISA